MVKEAAEHEAEDKERRESIERRNKLDNLCYTLEKTIAENKEKIGDVSSIESLIREGRQAVEKQDDAAVSSVSERLEKEAHRIASVMYQGAGGTPGAGPNGGPTDGGGSPGDGAAGGDGKKKDGGVIDAEFEETGG
jgi:molecular chaperone DnaK